MTTWPESMPALAERVSLVPANRTVDEVVDRLVAIEQKLDGFFSPAAGTPAARRERPPLPDGVACFNGMYLQVTEAVRDELPTFERRDERGILALQFAIAGMNAHINNDLAHALVLTWRELDLGPARDSPEFRDYEKVNAILEAVEADIKGPLADDLIASVDTLLGSADDFLALWSIRRARADAWKRAAIMRGMPDAELDSLFDGFVGFAGNLLLRPSVLLG